MTGNKLINMKLQNYFLNFCIGLSVVMMGVIIYSKFVV